MNIKVYDTTLRDGSQMEGLSFSLSDKIKIAKSLINFGVDFVEGGYPSSNPKDNAFFVEAKKLDWKNTKLTAFCATHHPKNTAEEDAGLKAVLDTGVDCATLFGKTWSLHTQKILGISKERNIELISDSVAYLHNKELKVFFDAEHFFDGFYSDEYFAMECLRAAVSAGAENISLCDTNGGMLIWKIYKAVKAVKKEFPDISIGIHAHNDSGLAEANSLAGVRGGADLVQGTINGYGERTGNANLCVVLPSLVLKMDKKLPHIDIKNITSLSAKIAEIANFSPPKRAPYVGINSFAHKAGVHVSAVEKLPESYEHINPEEVGNSRHITVSELSGRANIVILAREIGFEIEKDSDFVKKVLAEIKKKESEGFVFEGARASFELVLRRMKEGYKTPFSLVDFLISDQFSKKEVEAEIQLKVGDKIKTCTSQGNGPVNALDKALRSALIPIFPILKNVKLTDYKVRILNSSHATEACVRVLIESTDGEETWTTVGSGEDITKASIIALMDALEFLIK